MPILREKRKMPSALRLFSKIYKPLFFVLNFHKKIPLQYVFYNCFHFWQTLSYVSSSRTQYIIKSFRCYIRIRNKECWLALTLPLWAFIQAKINCNLRCEHSEIKSGNSIVKGKYNALNSSKNLLNNISQFAIYQIIAAEKLCIRINLF